MERSKRKNALMDYDGLYDEPADERVKCPRIDRKQKQSSQARVDPTYGQRSAFPGLDSYSAYTDEDDDLEYGDDIEALQYLQAVRNEAAGIPQLLVAPRPIRGETDSTDRSIYEDGTPDSRGFYSEGAYVGASTKESSDPFSGEIVLREVQAAYFESLLKRFHSLHDQLSTQPPQMVIDGLSSNHPSYMSNSREDLRSWRWRLFNTDPQPAQLAIMDKGTVFRLLRLILTNNGALGGKTPISRRLSRWIWGLLAKLPVSGELMSEEVGLIRELGKRAVWLGVEMRGVDIRELYKEDDEDDDEELVVDFEIIDGADIDPERATKSNRVIGPVIPRMEEGPSEVSRSGEAPNAVEEDLAPPAVFGSRAEAICSQQSALHIKKLVMEEAEVGKADDAGVDKEEEARITALKERLLASLDNQDSSEIPEADLMVNEDAYLAQESDHHADLDNAKITVDMIITIAGEVYGQRDLLEFREEWE